MYVIMAKKDGVVAYGMEPWVDGRHRWNIEFRTAESRLCLPWQYDSRRQAEDIARAWQKAFPADAEGWTLEIGWYGR